VRPAGLGAVALLATALLAGCGVTHSAAAAPVASPSGGTYAGPSTDPFPSGTPLLAGTPTRVRVPAIGVDSALESLHLDKTGALAAPGKYGEAGWYADGTVPGDVGPAVIAGHIDSKAGPAIFYKLGQLKPGDLIQVQRGGRWLDFHVISTGRYPKDAFPTAEVYGPTPDAQLRLITCGGTFDSAKRSYLDNTVVYAVAG
jgi:LPXTG-site transpeptidase (sortase) family protein